MIIHNKLGKAYEVEGKQADGTACFLCLLFIKTFFFNKIVDISTYLLT